MSENGSNVGANGCPGATEARSPAINGPNQASTAPQSAQLSHNELASREHVAKPPV